MFGDLIVGLGLGFGCMGSSVTDGSCAALAGTCVVASTCTASDYSYPAPAACEAVGGEDGAIAMSQANCDAADPTADCEDASPQAPGSCTCVYAADSACEVESAVMAAAAADRSGATYALHQCVLTGGQGQAACIADKTECVGSPGVADDSACMGYSAPVDTQGACEAAGGESKYTSTHQPLQLDVHVCV